MQDMELTSINFTFLCAQYHLKETNHIDLNSQAPGASLKRLHLREGQIMPEESSISS